MCNSREQTTPEQTDNGSAIHVLIVAAGTGSRFQKSSNAKTDHINTPKQYLKIAGKSLLERSVSAFDALPEIKTIRCIIGSGDANMYQDAILHLKSNKIMPPVDGGKTRQESVRNGLNALEQSNQGRLNDIILIHDAARPLIKENDINALIDSMATSRAATLATPVTGTIRREDDNQNCAQTIDRNGLWAMQTPQAFRFQDLQNAYDKAETAGTLATFTDDTSLITSLNIPVQIVEGSTLNFKITTKDDFDMAETILNAENHNQKTIIRTGLGYDVHAFDHDNQNNKKHVLLCGVDVPHDFPLKGHSDADVGLHAITDAILGAIGEGDIGQHFPPSDNTFKNMDSALFLEKAMEIARAKNVKLINVDITLICEEPKIGPYAPNMRQRVADIVSIDPDFINIKATTSERLGFTGRKEGIAAQAIATLEHKI